MTAFRYQLGAASVIQDLRRQFNNGPGAIILAVLVFAGFLSLATPGFASTGNAVVLSRDFSITALYGFAQMVILASGGLNLSVGAIGGLAAITAGGLMESFGVPTPVAIAASLALGTLLGAANGVLIARSGLPSFIITLATASIFVGIDLGLTESEAYFNLPADFLSLGSADLFGVPVLLIITLAAGLLLWALFSRVGIGLQILAVGAKASAAQLVGVSIGRTITAANALSGLLAGLAGVLAAARLTSAQPTIGVDWLLPSFAAPILGGVLLAGGNVSVVGCLFGAILLSVLSNGLVFLNVDPYIRSLLVGVVILGAAAIDRLRTLSAEATTRANRERR
jgi:ribose transport system permease protein